MKTPKRKQRAIACHAEEVTGLLAGASLLYRPMTPQPVPGRYGTGKRIGYQDHSKNADKLYFVWEHRPGRLFCLTGGWGCNAHRANPYWDDRADDRCENPYPLLWVQECFFVDHCELSKGPLPKSMPGEVAEHEMLYWRADGECCEQIPECLCASETPNGTTLWRSATQMPRWASRVLLDLKDLDFQRVQEITEEEARAAGFKHKAAFANFWDSRYAAKGLPFEANPWAWRYRVDRLTPTPSGPNLFDKSEAQA